MLSNIFFYTLSFILILFAIITVISPKTYLSCIFATCFFFFNGILFFSLNSLSAGFLEIFILTILFGIILFNCYKNVFHKFDFEENIFKNSKFIYGFIFSLILIFIIGLFIYYFLNYSGKDSVVWFSEKSLFSDIEILLMTSKSILVNYGLAYLYMAFIFIVSIGGAKILVTKNPNSKNEEGEKND